MLHYHLYTNCVCLLFGADKLTYSGFLEQFSWKQLSAVAEKRHYLSAECTKTVNLRPADKALQSWEELKIWLIKAYIALAGFAKAFGKLAATKAQIFPLKQQTTENQTPHHQSCVVEVPGVGGQAPVHRIHDRVLNDVYRARHASGEENLCPTR